MKMTTHSILRIFEVLLPLVHMASGHVNSTQEKVYLFNRTDV
jgi:hypothetical protein